MIILIVSYLENKNNDLDKDVEEPAWHPTHHLADLLHLPVSGFRRLGSIHILAVSSSLLLQLTLSFLQCVLLYFVFTQISVWGILKLISINMIAVAPFTDVTVIDIINKFSWLHHNSMIHPKWLNRGNIKQCCWFHYSTNLNFEVKRWHWLWKPENINLIYFGKI